MFESIQEAYFKSRWQRKIGSSLLVALLFAQTYPIGFAQVPQLDTSNPTTLGSSASVNSASVPVRGEISIARDVKMAKEGSKISLSLRDANIRDVLNVIAKQGGFNVIIDKSVTGTLTVDVNNISINKALEYIFTITDLSYVRDGNTMMVAAKDTAELKNLTAQTFKAIPVLYKSASVIVSEINQTLFSVPRPGSSKKALAAADLDTNSILVMGNDEDIRLVGNALKELDVPRNRKVYHIRHSEPSFVAQVLAANFFTSNGTSAVSGSSSGSSGSSSNSANSNSQQSGAGGNSSAQQSGGGQASAGGASGGGAGGAASSSSSSSGSSGSTGASGASGAVAGPTVTNVGGVTFIAEPISSTLTVLATDEQLSLIDSAIQDIDVRRPQVSIEVSLVEMQVQDQRGVNPRYVPLQMGSYKIGLLQGGGTNTITWAGGPLVPKGFIFSKDNASAAQPNPFSFTNTYQVTKAKILANPNVVALDNTTSKIDITDEVPTFNATTTTSASSTTSTTSITKQTVGINVNITPKISNDGTVLLSLTPKISQPIATVTAPDGSSSTVLISQRSLDIQSVRVRDGETLAIGGLLRESSSVSLNKVPGLSDLPVVGAMLRATGGNPSDKRRTELVLLVTPHILKDEATTYFTQPGGIPNNTPYQNTNQGSVQPVALPKFINHSSIKNDLIPAVSEEKKENQVSQQTIEPLKPKSFAFFRRESSALRLSKDEAKEKSINKASDLPLNNFDEVIK